MKANKKVKSNLMKAGCKKLFTAIANVFHSVKYGVRHLFHIRLTRSLSGSLINILVLSLISVIMLIPMLYVINNAFKPLDELFIFPPKLFVQNPTLDNIHDLISIMGDSWVPISRYLFNTVFITLMGTVFHVLFASMAAYVLEKHKFPGSKLFFALVITTLMFSPVITSIPNFVVMSKLHMVNTYFSIIIPAIGAPLGLFLMKQFMSTVPDTLLEAAKIDGASEFKIFFSIVMPTVKPAWLTLTIFSVQALWNSTGDIFIRSEELKPLPYALQQIMFGGVARAGAGSAVGLLLMIVPITIFLICQNNIMDTMATSGMKE
jgi:ABC-type glycerol-3-phosphate transport system permease component